MAKIDIVVLSYNRIEELKINLQKLSQLSYGNYTVIVVDNCSTDGSAEFVKLNYPHFQLIQMSYNSGVSVGRNAGFKRATGDIVIYLDDDAYPPLDLCEKTIELFDLNPNAGCLAYLIEIKNTGVYSNDSKTRLIKNYHGAGHAFRRSALVEIDYLDEDFFFGGEEIDSSLRMMEKGYEVIFAPEIVIAHDSRTRKLPISEQKVRAINYMKTFGMFYWKHFPIKHATLLTFKMCLSFFRHGVLNLNSPLLPLHGMIALYKCKSIILNKRKIASNRVIDFYY
ncbi:glycosyltransferase family 2 protein [Pontibacter sp. BAB1700]|uniref:glycosyltransferase family 2 protein n=1 Tax=Pontibacter sp. BAB1700 TaxID=1144253 RepID=UPI00026BE6E9|nr:glycosyltransferase family 2 protein [Pontibacter sp. BAB1700]EJF08305.1 family 2 glycosyl transferase [Pontibacter sp. BAB1700]